MKILSIDVGIKNLAICILETQDNNFNIIYWDVINLSEQKIYCCNCEIKYLKNKSTNKKNKNSKDDKDDKNIKQMNICGKQASFFKNDEYFCKTHYYVQIILHLSRKNTFEDINEQVFNNNKLPENINANGHTNTSSYKNNRLFFKNMCIVMCPRSSIQSRSCLIGDPVQFNLFKFSCRFSRNHAQLLPRSIIMPLTSPTVVPKHQKNKDFHATYKAYSCSHA